MIETRRQPDQRRRRRARVITNFHVDPRIDRVSRLAFLYWLAGRAQSQCENIIGILRVPLLSLQQQRPGVLFIFSSSHSHRIWLFTENLTLSPRSQKLGPFRSTVATKMERLSAENRHRVIGNSIGCKVPLSSTSTTTPPGSVGTHSDVRK